MDNGAGSSRSHMRPDEARAAPAAGAPDWVVTSIERSVWCLLAIVGAIMVYLAIT